MIRMIMEVVMVLAVVGMMLFIMRVRNLQNPLKRFELVARTAKKEK